MYDYPGDNRQTLKQLQGIADRVILGLIPSSMNAWGLAIRCLKDSGGILHIHMNVHENEIDDWADKTAEWFATASGKSTKIIHVETVKQYCPHNACCSRFRNQQVRHQAKLHLVHRCGFLHRTHIQQFPVQPTRLTR